MLAGALMALTLTTNPGPGPGLHDALRMATAVQWNAAEAWNDAQRRARMTATTTGASSTAASSASPSQSRTGPSFLARVRECESGGDYTAVSPDGTYRGAYQFDRQTWAAVGGTGDPADATPAEQDARAQTLYDRRGTSPWPNCGSR